MGIKKRGEKGLPMWPEISVDPQCRHLITDYQTSKSLRGAIKDPRQTNSREANTRHDKPKK